MPEDAFAVTDFDLKEAGTALWKASTAVDKPNQAAYLSSWSKRILDLAAASTLLAFVLPLLLVTSIAIVVTSAGGPLFLQRRYGQGKSPFLMYKLRSMRVDAAACFRQATPSDPRVTGIGRIIRKTSIDELPQLLNVLKGDMSLVGPRPHAVEHDDQFAPRIFGYDSRYHARPGITGLAQVTGARGETPTIGHMRQRLDLDLRYIRDASFKLDCIIMLETARNILFSPANDAVF